MTSRVLRLFLFFLFLSGTYHLSAQHFNFRNYSVTEGLAQSQVYCMLEDHQGYLWLGTQGGGLSRFDGEEFQSYSTRNGLADNYIESLFQWKQQLLIGTQKGLSILENGQIRSVPAADKKPLTIYAFYPWEEKTVLLGTNRGLFTFDGKILLKYREIAELRIRRINHFFKDKKGTLWMATNRGALGLKDEQKTWINRSTGLTNENVTSVSEDQQGNIWLTTFDGVFIWDGQQLTQWKKENGLCSNFLTNVYTDREGRVWIGSQDGGLSVWDARDSTLNTLSDEQGLCNNHVRQTLQDSWGNIWIGTSGGGICKYFGQALQHRIINKSFNKSPVYAVAQDTTQNLWVSNSNDGLARIDSSGLNYFDASNGFVNEKCKAIFRDSRGRMWFGSNNRGIAYWDGATFQFLKNRGEPVGTFLRDITEDEQGNIWLASASQGIGKIRTRDTLIQMEYLINDSLYMDDSLVITARTEYQDSLALRFDVERFTRRNGLPSNNINALYLDQRNRLWFGTRDRGLGYYSSNGIVSLEASSGLPNRNIRCLVADSLGFLWVGTAGSGIARLNIYGDSLRTKIFNEKDGLSSGNIYLMKFDRQGTLWVGCGDRIDAITLDADHNLLEVRPYGPSEGFIGEETCQNAVLEGERGELWFGTMNGLTKYVPGNVEEDTLAPKLHLTDIRLFYESFPKTPYAEWVDAQWNLKPGLELPYNKNHLGFSFKGVHLANPEKVRYQWQMQGQEEGWSPLGKNDNVTYSNIAPGDYTFRVRATDGEGRLSPPIELSFTIKTPIWQRWWFIASGIALLALLVFWLFRFRLNQVKNKARAEQERLEMENNLLQLEQKALQLQMNPHFIFNVLNTVQSLFLNQEQATARQLLTKFARLMRSMLEHSRTNLISLQEEIDLLENYLSIEQYSRKHKFSYQITQDPTLDTEEVQIPPMMIQPFVENALIHGVNHLEKGGRIEIDFRKMETDKLQCSIKDNGIGRAASAKINAQKTRKHQSTALAVTRERLALLNSETPTEEAMKIIDLKHESGEAAGTQVILQMPLTEW